uniref:Wsv473 n=1 Tax=White spot syndrome virus TaxID=92652 RepID=A0A2U9GFU5_WSSV|nr:wsv473 [Shrimp white spot syndrome virus]
MVEVDVDGRKRSRQLYAEVLRRPLLYPFRVTSIDARTYKQGLFLEMTFFKNVYIMVQFPITQTSHIRLRQDVFWPIRFWRNLTLARPSGPPFELDIRPTQRSTP